MNDLPAENLCGAVMATCRNEPEHSGDHWSPLVAATPADSLDAAYLERDALAEDEQTCFEDCERLEAAVVAALHELGVPGEGYPAPVANAVDILRRALRAEGSSKPPEPEP